MNINRKFKQIICYILLIFVIFASKDNLLRIKRLVGLFEKWVTRLQPFVFLSSLLLCYNVITMTLQK